MNAEHTEHCLDKEDDTYKCLVLTSKSSPGVSPLETGMLPVSRLSVRSSQKRLVKLPIEAGTGPLNLFEFRDLQGITIPSYYISN